MIVTAGLVVLGGGEGLLLLGRDRRVPLDELGEDAPLGLQAERQRGHVEQEHALDVAGQDRPLDGRADGHDLVGVDPLVRLLAEDLLDDLLDPRHPGRAADQHHLVDVRGLQLGVLQGLQDRPAAALEEVVGQLARTGCG